MSSSSDLFSRLKSFKRPDKSGNSPQQQLLNYCVSVLGSVERLHVDFKEKQDRRVSSLGDSDKKNLAKAISGFANSGSLSFISPKSFSLPRWALSPLRGRVSIGVRPLLCIFV